MLDRADPMTAPELHRALSASRARGQGGRAVVHLVPTTPEGFLARRAACGSSPLHGFRYARPDDEGAPD